MYVSRVCGVDAGMVQTYRIADLPDYARSIEVGPGWSGVDYFTGEAEFRGRGLAPLIIEEFLRAHVFDDRRIATCVSGPDPANERSIRTLRREGFRHLRTVEISPGESEFLMTRDSPAKAEAGP